MFGRLRLAYAALFALAGCVFVVAAAVGKTSLPQYFAISFDGRMLPIWVLPPLLWFGALAVRLTLRRAEHPSRTILRMARRHRNWLLRGTALTFLALPLGRAFGAIKDAIPRIVPYYADPYFIEMDRLLFRTDPWRLTHALFGPMATVVIDRIYVLWFFVMMAMLAWMAFSRDQKLQVRGLLAINLTWVILGNAMAIALASVGPCFLNATYGRADFVPLMDRLQAIAADQPLRALWAMDYLLKVRGTEAIGAGISAMPSLHVAIAFLFWLMCRGRVWPPLRTLAGAFAIAIGVGSVHLGWHYAVDGIVSVIVTLAIWRTCGRFVDWVARRESSADIVQGAPSVAGAAAAAG